MIETKEKFSVRLRKSVWNLHSMADSSSLTQDIKEAKTTVEDMKKITASLFYIYKALEEEIEKNKNERGVKDIYFKELFRVPNLIKDLEFYFGKNYEDIIYPTVATQLYVSRIKLASSFKPYLLIAHSYVRYMGDLSGGQMIKEMIKESLGLSSNEGVMFYEFEDIENPTEFKKLYRERLDNLDLSEEELQDIMKEANIAFLHNINLFREINRPVIYPDEIEKPNLLEAFKITGT